MLCPCCGVSIRLGILSCACGARFVGNPVSEPHVIVKSFGPLAVSVLFLILVVSLSFTVTKWFALAGVVVLWFARRAARLAKQKPEAYGGYRVAAGIVTATLIAGIVSGGLGIAYIGKYLENREISKRAATMAEFHRLASQLEEYKRECTFYPAPGEYAKVIGDANLDYWQHPIHYRPSTESVAGTGRVATPPAMNFELRSMGPDGKINTADDIVMRDGLFVSPLESGPTSPAVSVR
jgi:hypothetical protein